MSDNEYVYVVYKRIEYSDSLHIEVVRAIFKHEGDADDCVKDLNGRCLNHHWYVKMDLF